MLIFEFLNRISFFSIITWSFSLVAVLCALILTNTASPLTRKYRRSLLAVAISSILLAIMSWSTPYIMGKINPDQSRLTPIDDLVRTEWVEPIENPKQELPSDETEWTKNSPFQFKFKLKLGHEFKKVLLVQGTTLIYLSRDGAIRGFNAYTGLNRFSIPIQATHPISHFEIQKKLFLLDLARPNTLRVSCFDSNTPSLLWQRTIPSSKEGSLSFDLDSQSILVATGNSGIWSLKAKTGEILWKHPEIYSKTKVVSSQKHLLVFEPVIAGKPGAWYFIDALTGKIIQRIPHVYSDIQEILPPAGDLSPPLTFMGRVNSENYFYLNHMDLSQVWTFKAPEPIAQTATIDLDRYLAIYESGRLEMRTLKDNVTLYEKMLSSINTKTLKPSPDRNFLAALTAEDPERVGVAFYQAQSGDYLVTARASEALQDFLFFGDWLYLFSENDVWAFKR